MLSARLWLKRIRTEKRHTRERIATNALRDRLNSLVERGLPTKSDDPERKGRTRYAFTERAITLVPVLVHLGHWGDHWLPAAPALRRMRGLEVIKFHSPSYRGGNRHAPANTPGIRHLAFAVEDIDGVVARLRARGAELVGELEN